MEEERRGGIRVREEKRRLGGGKCWGGGEKGKDKGWGVGEIGWR